MTVDSGKAKGLLTWEKQEHLVKLSILLLAAVLCEYFRIATCMNSIFAEAETPIYARVCVCVRVRVCESVNEDGQMQYLVSIVSNIRYRWQSHCCHISKPETETRSFRCLLQHSPHVCFPCCASKASFMNSIRTLITAPRGSLPSRASTSSTIGSMIVPGIRWAASSAAPSTPA